MVSFIECCRQHGGSKLASLDGYELPSADDLEAVVTALGYKIIVPDLLRSRRPVLYRKYGQLVARYPTLKDDPQIAEWNRPGKSHWELVIGGAESEQTVAELDAWIRCLNTPQHRFAGWAYLKDDGDWVMDVRTGDAKMVVQSKRYRKTDAEMLMGRLERHPWTIAAVPFAPAELPGRQWNLDSPQWRYEPALGSHAHWDLILEHCGQTLTKYLADLDWARAVNIQTGGDYLRAIFASILREPLCKTPYLFLFGPENSGKSILHEAFDLLVTKGVVKADRALTSQSDFNGELAGAILCVVEEKDISKTPGAHAKIKEAVTALRLSIRRMRTDAYDVDNTTHWLQCANSFTACPKFPGDTRIQPIHVPPLPLGGEIPKTELLQRLKAEAPAFLHTVKHLVLPEPSGRLRVPLVETEHSRELERRNTDPVVMELIDFVTTNKQWVGTAPELSCLVEGTPHDYRPLWRFLEKHQMILTSSGIYFRAEEHSAKHRGAKRVELRHGI